MKILVAVLFILPAVCISADVYSGGTTVTPESKIHKCKNSEGKITLSNVGCNVKEKAEQLTVTPNVIDSSGLRGYARRNPPKVEVAVPKSNQPFFNAVECDNAKRMYEFAAGYKYARPGEAFDKSKEVFRQCGYWP